MGPGRTAMHSLAVVHVRPCWGTVTSSAGRIIVAPLLPSAREESLLGGGASAHTEGGTQYGSHRPAGLHAPAAVIRVGSPRGARPEAAGRSSARRAEACGPRLQQGPGLASRPVFPSEAGFGFC